MGQPVYHRRGECDGAMTGRPRTVVRQAQARARADGNVQSETTAPSAVRSFDPVPETSDDGVSETTVTETATESGAPEERSRRTSDASEEWEEAH